MSDRRTALGISIGQLAVRSGVSVATVNRALSGNRAVSLESIQAIANSLGLSIEAQPLRYPKTFRARQAIRKSRRLMNMAHGNAALEGQGVSKEVVKKLRKESARRLLAKKSALWDE